MIFAKESTHVSQSFVTGELPRFEGKSCALC